MVLISIVISSEFLHSFWTSHVIAASTPLSLPAKNLLKTRPLKLNVELQASSGRAGRAPTVPTRPYNQVTS